MASSESDPRERARARRAWPVRVHRLGDEPGDDISDTTSAAERIGMMWPLAVEAWSVAGHSIPDYSRRDIPARLIRPPGRDISGPAQS